MHQIDNPAGPDHNTKGSVQGEAGNRKIQRTIGSVREPLRVNMVRQFILCFESKHKQEVNDFIALLDVYWTNVKMTSFKWNGELCIGKNENFNVKVDDYFVLCFKLDFKINYATLASKFSKGFEAVAWWEIINEHRFNLDDTNIDNELKAYLTLLSRNGSMGRNIDNEIQIEQTRREYSATHPSNCGARRKLTFD